MPPVDPLRRYLSERIDAGAFPGAAYQVSDGRRVLASGALGAAVLGPPPIEVRDGTLFDLASLTKPLATALLAVLLQRDGRLRLEDRLERHLPAWRAADSRREVTLLDLLVHRSGLPAWTPLYLEAPDRQGRVEWLLGTPLESPPGRRVAYSCPGFILLGFALENAGGAPLDRLFRERITEPLGLGELGFNPPAALRPGIAATEVGNLRERQLAGDQGAGYNGWRTDLIWGEVHDTNARSLGGAAGNAGLFGTARAVEALAREFLGTGHGMLAERDLPLFRISRTEGLEEERSIGFQMAGTARSAAGPALSPASFGHTGFTGTSLWIDPEASRIYVLLTNRVHPRFRDGDMHAVRREFHSIAARL